MSKEGSTHPDMTSPVALSEWQHHALSVTGIIALFSVVVNILMLTLPIYLFQISDRVLTSRSLDTLLMLSLLAFCFLGVLSIMDILRRQILARLATRLEVMVGGPVLASIINNARAGEGGTTLALRSLQQVRTFICSPIMLLIIDVPLTPIYFGAIFLVHATIGWIALAAGAVLFVIALANQRVTASPLARAGIQSAATDAVAEALGRNAQVINAMGMLNQGILHWGRQQAQTLALQNEALGLTSGLAALLNSFAISRKSSYSAAVPISRSKASSPGHDDRRFYHRRPRVAAARRPYRRLAQLRADMCGLFKSSQCGELTSKRVAETIATATGRADRRRARSLSATRF